MSSSDPAPSESPARVPLGGDFIIPLIACGQTLYYLASTTDLVWEARATGTVIGLTLLVLCAAHLVRLGLRISSGSASLGTGTLFENDLFNRQRAGLAAMVAIYIVTIYWVGATVGLFFLLVGCMRLLGVKSWRTLIAVALVAAVFVHLSLITLLDSKLPRGWIIDQFSTTSDSEPAPKTKPASRTR
jgi:hypothetical protein